MTSACDPGVQAAGGTNRTGFTDLEFRRACRTVRFSCTGLTSNDSYRGIPYQFYQMWQQSDSAAIHHATEPRDISWPGFASMTFPFVATTLPGSEADHGRGTSMASTTCPVGHARLLKT